MTGSVATVQRMASELASRVRYAQIVGHPIPAEQVTALVAAARLLQDYGEPWPHVVAEALHEFAEGVERDSAAPEGRGAPPAREAAVSGLSRLLGAFRKGKGHRLEAGA